MTSKPDTEWIKAERSNTDGSCVEMRRHAGSIEVRDTKQQKAGPTLRFTDAEFAAWVEGAKGGEFDSLL